MPRGNGNQSELVVEISYIFIIGFQKEAITGMGKGMGVKLITR